MTYYDLLSHILLGISSSFLGTLPLGILNLTVLQMALNRRQNEAVAFSLGATVIEFCQIIATLMCMDSLLAIPELKWVISLISIPVLLYLGIKNFKKPTKPILNRVNVAPKSFKQEFFRGVYLGFANVVVYPFWLLWGQIFVQKAISKQIMVLIGFFLLVRQSVHFWVCLFSFLWVKY
ncbi:MAG: LysE family transporter [Saprospiraceae bacterium]|nr:LysE family transporter [Saprospiraceae bacterium]